MRRATVLSDRSPGELAGAARVVVATRGLVCPRMDPQSNTDASPRGTTRRRDARRGRQGTNGRRSGGARRLPGDDCDSRAEHSSTDHAH